MIPLYSHMDKNIGVLVQYVSTGHSSLHFPLLLLLSATLVMAEDTLPLLLEASPYSELRLSCC